MSDSSAIVNISAYHFQALEAEDLPVLRGKLKDKALRLGIKGTILLSPEGINLFLASGREPLEAFKAYLVERGFVDLPYKESFSDHQPFTRMLVRIKKEIISMGVPEVVPHQKTAPHLPVEQLRAWYEQGKDMVILDTRNDYEVRLGTFENAIDLNIKTFRDFPEAIKQLPEEMKQKPVVTFCTGGIRCEKAAALMQQQGFAEVYQLHGGILKYLEECGGEHYEGECFVFDKRVALNAELTETETVQCFSCRQPISAAEQATDDDTCPYCDNSRHGKVVND